MTREIGLALLLSLATLGCRSENAPDSERRVPWQAGTAVASQTEQNQNARLTLAEGSSVAISLRAKEAHPEGKIPVRSGEVTVNLNDLAQTRGSLEFDLARLGIAGDDGHEDAERSAQARQWLGVAPGTPSQLAHFEFQRLDDPSELRPSNAPKQALPGGGTLRKVRGTLVGRLILRRLAVDHRLPVLLEFEYGKRGELRAVRTSLIQPAVVALAEHDVVPRDAAFRELSSERALLGRVVGTRAAVRAQMTWNPSGLSPPPQ